jgi:hypothetical protein
VACIHAQSKESFITLCLTVNVLTICLLFLDGTPKMVSGERAVKSCGLWKDISRESWYVFAL